MIVKCRAYETLGILSYPKTVALIIPCVSSSLGRIAIYERVFVKQIVLHRCPVRPPVRPPVDRWGRPSPLVDTGAGDMIDLAGGTGRGEFRFC